MSQEKAEKKTLQKLNLSQLMEKPKEYRVNFVLHAADDDSPAIDMLDVSFGYSEKKDKCLFQNIRLKVDLRCDVVQGLPGTIYNIICVVYAYPCWEITIVYCGKIIHIIHF